MTEKIVLPEVGPGFTTSTINDNFQKIANALNEQVLYRSNPTEEGAPCPNQMFNELDMNSNRQTNLPMPSNDNEPARLVDLKLVTGSIENIQTVVPVAGPNHIGDGIETVFSTAATEEVIPTTMSVIVDKGLCVPYADYTIDSNGNVVFTSAPNFGASIDTIWYQPSIDSAVSVVRDATNDTVTVPGTSEIRTLGQRFSSVLNVKDFGAVGNGITDDTVALQAAINYASANNSALTFDRGTYIINPVTAPSNTYGISQVGLVIPEDSSLYASGATGHPEGVVIKFAGPVGASTAMLYSRNSDELVLDDIKLDCSSTAPGRQPCHPMFIGGTENVEIGHVVVSNYGRPVVIRNTDQEIQTFYVDTLSFKNGYSDQQLVVDERGPANPFTAQNLIFDSCIGDIAVFDSRIVNGEFVPGSVSSSDVFIDSVLIKNWSNPVPANDIHGLTFVDNTVAAIDRIRVKGNFPTVTKDKEVSSVVHIVSSSASNSVPEGFVDINSVLVENAVNVLSTTVGNFNHAGAHIGTIRGKDIRSIAFVDVNPIYVAAGGTVTALTIDEYQINSNDKSGTNPWPLFYCDNDENRNVIGEIRCDNGYVASGANHFVGVRDCSLLNMQDQSISCFALNALGSTSGEFFEESAFCQNVGFSNYSNLNYSQPVAGQNIFRHFGLGTFDNCIVTAVPAQPGFFIFDCPEYLLSNPCGIPTTIDLQSFFLLLNQSDVFNFQVGSNAQLLTHGGSIPSGSVTLFTGLANANTIISDTTANFLSAPVDLVDLGVGNYPAALAAPFLLDTVAIQGARVGDRVKAPTNPYQTPGWRVECLVTADDTVELYLTNVNSPLPEPVGGTVDLLISLDKRGS